MEKFRNVREYQRNYFKFRRNKKGWWKSGTHHVTPKLKRSFHAFPVHELSANKKEIKIHCKPNIQFSFHGANSSDESQLDDIIIEHVRLWVENCYLTFYTKLIRQFTNHENTLFHPFETNEFTCNSNLTYFSGFRILWCLGAPVQQNWHSMSMMFCFICAAGVQFRKLNWPVNWNSPYNKIQ